MGGGHFHPTVDNFVDSESTKLQQFSIPFNNRAAKGSTESLRINSIRPIFNNLRNPVRDQGVGGSNPLSPTNIFKQIQTFCELRKTACRQNCRYGIFSGKPQ